MRTKIKFSFQRVIVSFVMGLTFSLGSCSGTDFSGSSNSNRGVNPEDPKSGSKPGKSGQTSTGDTGKSPDDPNNYQHGGPISSNLEDTGWIDTKSMADLKELFGSKDRSPNGGRSDTGGGGLEDGGRPGSQGDSSSGGKNGSKPGEGNGNNSSGGSSGDSGDNGKGKGDVPAWSSNDVGVFWVPCADQSTGGEERGTIKGPLGAKIRMAGEFCPRKLDAFSLTVLFIVDFSGSMTGPHEGPNDPGDNCGRLRAAEALMTKFSGKDYEAYKLQFALVGFSSSARVRIPISDLDTMRGSINPANWCGSDGSTARTNYRAAFEAAQQVLSGVSGNTLIYFISDGSPTTGGGGGLSDVEAGLAAAKSLRDSKPDSLLLNAVFLGYTAGSAVDPQGYLEQITSDPMRVRLVDAADGLVEAVTSLDTGAELMNRKDVQGSLTTGRDSQDVGIASFKPHKSKPGVFVFLTQPFELKGKVNEVVENILSVSAVTADGTSIESKAIIEYLATP